MKAKFIREKETKGTWRYKELTPNDSPPVIGTIYIKKYALTDNFVDTVPEMIEVTITRVEETDK